MTLRSFFMDTNTVQNVPTLYRNFIAETGKVVVGNENAKRRVFAALLTNQHLVFTSVPGLAKTTLISAVQAVIDGAVSAVINFVPDMLPNALIGSRVFDQQHREYRIEHGKLFGSHIVLADEINRSPQTTQAALLGAMQERRISIDGQVFELNTPFMVFATQNPVEQEGTYPLPEAQIDRFLFNPVLTYNTPAEQAQIVRLQSKHGTNLLKSIKLTPVCSITDIVRLTQEIQDNVRVPEQAIAYAVNLVRATRPSDALCQEHLKEHTADIALPASQRAPGNLIIAAKVEAAIEGRDYVSLDDIKSVARDVLRHRIGLMPAAVRRVTTDAIITKLLERVPTGTAEYASDAAATAAQASTGGGGKLI
jgi:MoxR-like ATPase